jgi:hypothetical protein
MPSYTGLPYAVCVFDPERGIPRRDAKDLVPAGRVHPDARGYLGRLPYCHRYSPVSTTLVAQA